MRGDGTDHARNIRPPAVDVRFAATACKAGLQAGAGNAQPCFRLADFCKILYASGSARPHSEPLSE